MDAYDKHKRNKFIRFLKDNNIYEKFMYCFNNRHCSEEFKYDTINSFNIYVTVTRYDDLFTDSFLWRKTKDGFSFWSQYNEMWRDERYNNI